VNQDRLASWNRVRQDGGAMIGGRIRDWIPEERIRSHRALRRLGALLHRPSLWRFNRRTVAQGLAIGLFVAFVPAPGQMLLAGIGAAWTNSNLPVSVAAVWLTNPLTIPPMFYAAYRLGAWLLGVHPEPVQSWSLAEVGRLLAECWQPFLLGCLIAGLASALLGYLLVHLGWRISIWRRWRRRRLALAA